MRRFVFGDIHGQFDGLMQLVDLISPQKGDRLYFLGDLIDRGAKSAEVVSWVIRYGNGCLKGNHEQMCIEAHNPAQPSFIRQGWLTNGGIKTLESYGEKGMPIRHLDWMRSLPLYLDLDDVWLVHAGVDPNKPLDKQTAAEFCWIRAHFTIVKFHFLATKLSLLDIRLLLFSLAYLLEVWCWARAGSTLIRVVITIRAAG